VGDTAAPPARQIDDPQLDLFAIAIACGERDCPIAAGGEFTDPEWREVVGPGGVKYFTTANNIVARTGMGKLPIPSEPTGPIPADLLIPNFLKRTASAVSATTAKVETGSVPGAGSVNLVA
jgi:hypothetical protein